MVFPRNAQFQIKHKMMWGPDEYDQASLRHEDLEQNGPAVQPLDFPSPQVRSVSWKTVSVLDHRNRRVCDLRALVPSSSSDRMIHDGIDKHPSSDRAYLAKKKLSDSTYGSIRVCLVLKRRKKEPEEKESDNDDPSSGGWESTNELVVIKASMWCRIRMARTQLLEDPLKEAAALLLVGNYHKHVLGCSEVLQDETFLYMVMPYCAGGSLYTRILGSYNLFPSHGIGPNLRPDENRARVWFIQLLDSLSHLQKKGICHRDICLENLLLVSCRDLDVSEGFEPCSLLIELLTFPGQKEQHNPSGFWTCSTSAIPGSEQFRRRQRCIRRYLSVLDPKART